MNTLKRIRHFAASEFIEDQDPSRPALERMNQPLIRMLDYARDLAAVPFVITSSLRSREHNEAIGGAYGSSHLFGDAVDISCEPFLRPVILPALFAAGFRRVGIYANHVHVDISDKEFRAGPHKDPAVWLG